MHKALSEPLFSSPRDALRFALNYHLALPRPQMNKMMADGKVQRIVLADGTKITVAAPKAPARSEQLRGLDGAATAGIVLAHLARLPDEQQLVLMAYSMIPELPCSCRAPCCRGSKPNPDWTRVVQRICDHLRDEAQLTKVKGKKGLSTHPMLRKLLVEKFFQPKRDMPLAWLAKLCDITEQTVIAHRKPILVYLEKQENTGWRAFDESLGEASIVGHMN